MNMGAILVIIKATFAVFFAEAISLYIVDIKLKIYTISYE